jgi:hypothetical protein
MMKLALFLSLLGLPMLSFCETVEVFTCTSRSHNVVWGDPGDEENTSYMTVYRLGKKVGTIDTGDFDLAKVVAHAKAQDKSMDPFYGPETSYILKDSKGKFYLAFFEYEEGHKTFDGMRVAMNEATPVGSLPHVFEGSPYEGSCFDKKLLAQFKEITRKLPKK